MQWPWGIGLRGFMDGVVRWFERRGEIALVPPARLREYAAITDDPDKFGGGYSVEGIRGVAFAIEYCDSHGLASIRTIRCLGIDTRHPASLTAYCHVREKICKFRIDRIISIMDLRSGRIVSPDEHLALLAPYLPDDQPEPYLRTLINLQDATRDGVFALLQLGFARWPPRRQASRGRARLCEGGGEGAHPAPPFAGAGGALARQSRAATSTWSRRQLGGSSKARIALCDCCPGSSRSCGARHLR